VTVTRQMVSSIAPRRTVMVVDDNRSTLRLHGAILEKVDFRVIASESALDALVLLAHETPDLIVLDYMLPIMDGPMFLRELRRDARLRDVPVVVLTASQADAHVEAAFAAGANDYLIKPVDHRILQARAVALVKARRDQRKAAVVPFLSDDQDALLREVREARALQRSQLAATAMEWGGWRVAGALVPCGHVGGDLFDVITGPRGERTLALIDVSGHGLGAAMVASSIRSRLHLLLEGRRLEEVMASLNAHLCKEEGFYACVALMRVDAHSVTIVNAGLPPVAVIEKGRTVRLVAGDGTPPGLLPSATYEAACVPREPGIRFVAMSDGLTEPFGQVDGTARTAERLGLFARSPGSDTDLEARILSLFGEDKAGQPDDATLLVLSDQGGAE
jgi:CheY-like chemotaxis protein